MINKFKRILACTAAGMIIVLLSGCSLNEAVDNIKGDVFENVKFDDDSSYTSVPAAESIDCEYYESNGEITFGYDSLYTESQINCYKSIGKAVYRISEEKGDTGFYPVGKVTVSDKDFTEKDMDICIKAYTMDHPEVFWLTNRYSYGSMGNKAVIQLYSYVSGKECQKYIETLNNTIDEIVTNIPSGLKQYHLEKYIHNTVLENCTYATGVTTSDDGWEEFTVYGALVNGRAVCEGYAHSMCLLLNKVGIDCYYANGYGENSPHMWNTVNIDGNWYHLDSTWDDNENAYFNYFNLDDDQIKEDHMISPLLDDIKDKESLGDVYNLYLPECSSDSANFFVVESTYIYDFEESNDIMVHDLVEAANNNDKLFTVKIDSAINFDNAIDVLFNKEPYYMFDYISQANKQISTGSKINDSNVSIIILENFNAVVVQLEYK